MYETEINKLFNAMGLNFSTIASEMLGAMIDKLRKDFPNFPVPESFWDKYRKNR
jgi:hypothetical protein